MLYLQSLVQLCEGSVYFSDEQVHALTLLHTHQDVGAAFVCLSQELCQAVLLWQLLQEVIQHPFHLRDRGK